MHVRDLGSGSVGDDEGCLTTTSGFVTPATRLTFRSRSSHMVLLIQMSKEMWQYDSNGELLFERLTDRFLPALYARWAALGATHCVSVYLFTRTFHAIGLHELAALAGVKLPDDARSSNLETSGGSSAYSSSSLPHQQGHSPSAAAPAPAETLSGRALCMSPDGRLYEDFYWPVIEDMVLGGSVAGGAAAGGGGPPAPAAPAQSPSVLSTAPSSSEWTRVLRRLKRAFATFPKLARWGCNPGSSSDGTPSLACQGNFLEAINLCLNIFAQHSLDRDICRMGQVCNVGHTWHAQEVVSQCFASPCALVFSEHRCFNWGRRRLRRGPSSRSADEAANDG